MELRCILSSPSSTQPNPEEEEDDDGDEEEEEERSMCILLFIEWFVRPCFDIKGCFHYCFHPLGMDTFVLFAK